MKDFINFFALCDRLAPGGEEYTLKALNSIPQLPDAPSILEIACGKGTTTKLLASHTNGTIRAIDYYEPFIQELKERIKDTDLQQRIKFRLGDMNNLRLKPEFYDLIWCEGAIYLLGFSTALQKWNEFLKPGGYIVVSDMVYRRKDIPNELSSYWGNLYVELTTVSTRIAEAENNGYECIAHFNMDKDAFLDNYYKPLGNHKENYLKREDNSDTAKRIVHDFDKEVEMYQKYSDYYTYTFFIMKKL